MCLSTQQRQLNHVQIVLKRQGSGPWVKGQGCSNALNLTDCLCLIIRIEKIGCNNRFLETTGQNLFLLGGYIDKSVVFQIPKKQVKVKVTPYTKTLKTYFKPLLRNFLSQGLGIWHEGSAKQGTYSCNFISLPHKMFFRRTISAVSDSVSFFLNSWDQT